MRYRVPAIGMLALALSFVSIAAQQSDPAAPAPAAPETAGAQPAGQSDPDAEPGQTPTFRSRIDAVTLDVIVTDRQGRPVLDLEPADFEIIENGTPQTIQNFELVQVDTSQPESSFVRDITSIDQQQRETAQPDTRVLVIFLDDYHVRIENSLRIRQDLARFVTQLTARDLVALMYPLTPVNGITFSRNHEATADAIMAFQGRKYNYIPVNAYEQRYANYPPEALEMLRNQIVTSALRGLATYLGTLREGKKQVLYVSEGMSGTLPAGMRTAGQTYGDSRVDPSRSQRFFSQMEVLDDLQRVFSAAARSNTSIYTLDPRGLAVFDAPLGNDIGLEEQRVILNEAQDLLRTLSYNTDGEAIVNRNDPLPELQRMVAQMNAYYLLGYTSTEAPRDGKFHEAKVRVKRPFLEVRARKGYWAYSPEEVERVLTPPRPGPPAAVEDALARLVVPRDHAVHAWIGSQLGPDGRARVIFAWEPVPSRGPSATGRFADTSDVVDRVVLTATSAEGGVIFNGPVPRDPQLPAPAGRVSFEAPPGDVRLQFVSENARGARIDSDDAIVEVPDFTGAGPLITRPAVYRGRTARAIQLIREADAPIPAVGREFSRTERLLLRFQAHGAAGAAPAITMRLLNNRGESMADLPAPTQRTDGTFEAELGLGSLAPADYVIEINARAGDDTAQSLVAVRVTP